MFIRRISICNFMIHRRTQVDLFPMTVLVGPNNSGKSSLFDALLNMSRVCSDPLSAAFPSGPYSYRSRHHNGDRSDEPIRFVVELAQAPDSVDWLRYEIAYRQVNWRSGKAEYDITEERLEELPAGRPLFDRESGETANAAVEGFLDQQTSFFAALRKAYFDRRTRPEGLVGHVAVNISRFGKFRLDPSLLSKPGATPDVLAPAGGRLTAPRMRYEGEGLASVLYFLDRTRDPRLEAIVGAVASAIDGFSGFEFNAVANDYVGFSARFADSRGLVEAPNLSAGTLSLIGWLTLLLRGDRQPILMLEEPELGLTPRSTRAVYDAASGAVTATQERTQLLVASHSPRILAWASEGYGNDHVYVMTPHDGAAEVATYGEKLDQGIPTDMTRAMSVDVANQVMHRF